MAAWSDGERAEAYSGANEDWLTSKLDQVDDDEGCHEGDSPVTRQPAAEEKEGAAGEGQHRADEQIGDDRRRASSRCRRSATDRPAGRFTGDQGGDDDGEDARQGNEAGGDLAPGGLRDEEGVEKVPAEQRRPEGEGDEAAARQALVADDRQVGDEMLEGSVVAGYDEEGGSARRRARRASARPRPVASSPASRRGRPGRRRLDRRRPRRGGSARRRPVSRASRRRGRAARGARGSSRR